jgi:hypothetical protein
MSAGRMAKMAARYRHFGIEELRGAVEAISRNGMDGSVFRAGYLQFSLFHYTPKRIATAVALTD